MTHSVDDVRGDIAFLRELVDQPEQPLRRDSAIMVAVGSIFGLMGLRGWLMASGLWDAPSAWRPWMLVDAPALFVLILLVLVRRFPTGAPGAFGRAMSAAWSAVGIGVAAMSLAFAAAAWRAENIDVMGLFTPMLFILYGMAWWIAYRMRMRASLGLIAMGSLATAGVTGALVGTPELWLAEAIGLFLWVLLPGVMGLRRQAE